MTVMSAPGRHGTRVELLSCPVSERCATGRTRATETGRPSDVKAGGAEGLEPPGSSRLSGIASRAVRLTCGLLVAVGPEVRRQCKQFKLDVVGIAKHKH